MPAGLRANSPSAASSSPDSSPHSGRSLFSDVYGFHTDSSPSSPDSEDGKRSLEHASMHAQVKSPLTAANVVPEMQEARRQDAQRQARVQMRALEQANNRKVGRDEDDAQVRDFSEMARSQSSASDTDSSADTDDEGGLAADVTPKARAVDLPSVDAQQRARLEQRRCASETLASASSSQSQSRSTPVHAVDHMSTAALPLHAAMLPRSASVPTSLPATPTFGLATAKQLQHLHRATSLPSLHMRDAMAAPTRSNSAPPAAPGSNFRTPPIHIRIQAALHFSIMKVGIPAASAYGTLVGLIGVSLTTVGLFDSLPAAFVGLTAMSWPIPAAIGAVAFGLFGYKLFFSRSMARRRTYERSR